MASVFIQQILPHTRGMWMAATEKSHAKWDHLDTERPQTWFPLNLSLFSLCRPKAGMAAHSLPTSRLP